MAHVTKEKKAKAVAGLKQIMPDGWKYSVSVRHHMTLVLTIYHAPIDLIGKYVAGYEEFSHNKYDKKPSDLEVNVYWMHNYFQDELKELFLKIKTALMTDEYFDDSDSQSDYFHRSHYFEINLGRWNKPFEVKNA